MVSIFPKGNKACQRSYQRSCAAHIDANQKFCLAVAMVLRLVPYVLGLTVIVLALWLLDRHALKTVDWGLLATFAAFFTFSGNLARMEPVRVLFARLLSHGTMLVSALTCQIISNVPAAILLSRFTQDARALLWKRLIPSQRTWQPKESSRRQS